MDESWFIRPETKILHIDGQTLTVRKRLNTGEQRRAIAAQYAARPDGSLRVDPFQIGIAKVVAYLLDWSLDVDIKGLGPDDLRSVLDNLAPERFTQIREAIDAHEIAMTAEHEAAKNGQDGGKNASAISPLPSALAGASTGSAH